MSLNLVVRYAIHPMQLPFPSPLIIETKNFCILYFCNSLCCCSAEGRTHHLPTVKSVKSQQVLAIFQSEFKIESPSWIVLLKWANM
jgi:hypothetical protein